MLKPFLRICALLILCTLLVFAPEIYKRASSPYDIAPPQRTLLRIALCTEDTQAVKAFNAALSIYMKQRPTLHLRITRHDEAQFFTLPDPQPDLFVFSPSLRFEFSRFLSPPSTLSALGGEPLRCAISSNSPSIDAALALLAYLTGETAP